MTWSIFVPTRGGVAKNGWRLTFADGTPEIATWKTSKGAHDAVFRGKANAIGAAAQSLWDFAVVDDTAHVKMLHAAHEAAETKAFNERERAEAAARFAAVEAGWEKNAVTVTFENAGGKTTIHYGKCDADCFTHHGGFCDCSRRGTP